MQLFYELESGTATETRRADAIRVALGGDSIVRGLFERFVPFSDRIERLGQVVDREAVLAIKGNAKQGRHRYLHSAAQQCRTCHRLGDEGRSVGPDFTGIAKQRTPADLLESILEPSKKIDPKYATFTVATLDGRIVAGLRVAHNDSSVTIRSADGKDHVFENDEIEVISPGVKSLMPDGLVADMTAEELADLLAFLMSQTESP